MDVYHPGQVIRSGPFQIRVEKPLCQGEMAYSYQATDLNTGVTVLFKTYCNMVPDLGMCPWFNKYIAHQDKIQKRLAAIPDQAIQILGHFNHNGTYHQIIEWARGRSLETLLEEEFDKSTALEKHLHLAKVLMFSLHKVHEQGIIHCDQKPANFFAEKRPELKIGYKVMMADFDMSLIYGEPSPKGDGSALAGTFGYFSPEHFSGKPATKASDVFTVGGVILYQLFAGVHPFQPQVDEASSLEEGNALIWEAIKARRIPRLEVVAPLRGRQVPTTVLNLIHLALDPDPGQRPTAKAIHSALMENRLAKTLVLKGGPAGLKWRIKENSPLSRSMCERFFGTALGAVSSEQGRFEPSEDRAKWYFTPREGTTNASMLNGKPIQHQIALESGMKLQVGNPVSGNIGLEMEVSFE
jgi:serine/threonine protein kinase